MSDYTATYSPEDNKLRLYAVSRLPKELYDRVRAHGFIWAPKQELFVAPSWTPQREDLLIELAGEIEDEDKSLVERQEERAERMTDYAERREADAERTADTVSQISERFAGGQPILVGHHSEKSARRDKEKMDNGMRKAVKLWEQSKYWKSRAAGAIRLAKYKELPAVRHRRIKGLEADARKYNETITNSELRLGQWKRVTDDEGAKNLANFDHSHYCFTLAKYPRETPKSQYEGDMSLWGALDHGIIDHAQAAALAIPHHERIIATYQRWLDHTENRLTYERAMLEESGGLAANKFNLEVGGRVLIRSDWVLITRINKKDGEIVSVTTTAKYCRVSGIELIKDYQPPEGNDAEKIKAAQKLPPMCNYPGEGFHELTKAQWDNTYKDYKGSKIIEATATEGRHRLRYLYRVGKSAPVFLTDAKRVDAPAPTLTPEPTPEMPTAVIKDAGEMATETAQRIAYGHKEQPTIFDNLKKVLDQGGVKVVVADQLFPTPRELAERMVRIADIRPGHEVLEPSAGTGHILDAIPKDSTIRVTAVEINWNLAKLLIPKAQHVHNGDFLECTGAAGLLAPFGSFDRIVMNPPFQNGDDIKHIKHAAEMLKPGGILVAICAGGPRQQKELQPLASYWEPLPPDTFKESGTGVNTVLLTIER